MNSIAIIIPILNDWQSARLLLKDLDEVFAANPGHAPSIYLVDDGSTEPCPEEDFVGPYRALRQVSLVPLLINVGHQRAIACGLVYVSDVLRDGPDTIVIMDGDGEDRPQDVPKLLAAFQQAEGRTVVFAERGHRYEGVVFKAGYYLYKTLFTALTGKGIRFGNFSVLHRNHATSLILAPELWLNYPATIQKRRLPFSMIRADRGKRLAGTSRMNLNSLIIHGLSAMAVNNELIGTRLILGLTVVIGLFGLAMVAVVGIRLFVPAIAIAGWATYTTGLLAVLILNSLTLGLSFVFSVLGTRTTANILPKKDAAHLLGQARVLSGRPDPDPASSRP